jgi:hypothetical protein
MNLGSKLPGLQQPVKGGAQDEAEIAGSQPLFGIWEYVTGMGCRPMGLPMFRPIFLCINRRLGNVRTSGIVRKYCAS